MIGTVRASSLQWQHSSHLEFEGAKAIYQQQLAHKTHTEATWWWLACKMFPRYSENEFIVSKVPLGSVVRAFPFLLRRCLWIFNDGEEKRHCLEEAQARSHRFRVWYRKIRTSCELRHAYSGASENRRKKRQEEKRKISLIFQRQQQQRGQKEKWHSSGEMFLLCC